MKHRDLMELMGALAPVLHDAMRDACAPLIKRLDEAENRVKELEARPVFSDDILTAGISKALPATNTTTMQLKIDGEEFKKNIDEALKNFQIDPADILKVVGQELPKVIPDLKASVIKEVKAELPSVEEIAKLVPAGKSVTVEEVTPLINQAVTDHVREMVATDLPAGIDKAVAAAVAELPPAPTLEQIKPLVAIEAKLAVDLLGVEDGKDADMELIAEQIQTGIKAAVADIKLPQPPTIDEIVAVALPQIPVPQDGKSVDREEVVAMVADEVQKIVKDVNNTVTGALEMIPTVDEVVAKIPVPKDGKDVDPEVVKTLVAEAVSKIELPQAPTAAEVAALIPVPQNGKDADPALIVAEVQSAVKEAVAAIELPKVPTIEEVVALIPKPADGKDADPEYVKMLVTEAVEAIELPKVPTVEEVLALIPKPQDGKNVEPATIKILIDEALSQIEMPEVPSADDIVAKVLEIIPKPKDGKSVTPEDLTPMLLTMVNETVDKKVAEIPRIVQDGKDADPEVTRQMVKEAVAAAMPATADIVALIPIPKDGKSVEIKDVQPIVEKLVSDAVEKIKPKDGKDGADVVDMVIDRNGHLIATLTNGSKDLGPIVGKDGDPGLGFEDMEVEDGPTSYTVRFKRGDKIKEWVIKKPTLADGYKQIWRKGTSYERGNTVTWGGSLFIALADNTDSEPGASDAWKLAVKRGQNGKDHPGGSSTPSTVKLK